MDSNYIRKMIEDLANPELGGRKWYQYFDFGNNIDNLSLCGGKAELRTKTFVEFLNNFDFKPDDKVLDIGSNAGLFTLICGEKCSDAIGVEIDEAFHKQALFLKKFWEENNRNTKNAKLFCLNLVDNLQLIEDRTIVLASKVLYHKYLGDAVYDLMQAIKDSPVRAILLQGHTTQGEKGQNEGMAKMMNDYGFTYEIINDVEEYPIAIAYRK